MIWYERWKCYQYFSLYSTLIFLKREQTLWAIKELDYYTFTHFSKPESNIIFTGLTTHPGFDTAKTLANFLVALINNYKIPITTVDKTQTTWNRTGHSCVMAPELWNILPQHLLYMNAPASPHSKHKWKRISLPYSPHSPPLPAPLPSSRLAYDPRITHSFSLEWLNPKFKASVKSVRTTVGNQVDDWPDYCWQLVLAGNGFD